MMPQLDNPTGNTLADLMPATEQVPPASNSSPRFNIADFELQFPPLAATTETRDTSYASQSAIDDLDFAGTEEVQATASRYGKGIRNSFFGKKFIPRAVATSNLPPTPPASQPGSGASSPTKSLASFISKGSDIPSSASRASVRASRVLFDNFFNGTSNPIHLGPLQQPYSRSHSRAPSSFSTASVARHEDGYEQDSEYPDMSYTRSPVRTRSRRVPTTDGTYSSKLGAWFSGNNKTSKATAALANEEADDPLMNLDVQQSLFPYGPVDPLDPNSFNDLLSAAEAAITTYQNAYRQRVSELNNLRSHVALKDDEFEESETRAQHLKMQLQDLGEQCTAQEQKATLLEGMLRERPVCNCQRSRQSSRVGRRADSDSGFESDEDSVLSAHAGTQQDVVRKSNFSGERVATTLPLFSNDVSRENQLLRMRVAELEGAVEGCLDMISGPWAMA